MKHLFMKSAAFAIAASLAADPVAAQTLQSQTTVVRIPSPYTGGETREISKLVGFIAVIDDITKVTVSLTNPNTPVDCDSIRDDDIRSNCKLDFSANKRNYCSTYYGAGGKLAQFQPPNGRTTDLMPIQNAIQASADFIDTKTDAFAFNLGFFETRSFTNRPAEGATWKGIYDETCTTISGTYSHNGVSFAGNWGDRQFFGGKADKPYTTFIIRQNVGIFLSQKEANVDDEVKSGDRVFSGVLLRAEGNDIPRSAGRWPAFVVDKADSVVGRTAMGIGADFKKVKIVVVQPGNGGTNTTVAGASIETVRNMFKKADYPFVVLLDGSGSSQFATSMTLDSGSGTPIAVRNRSGCVTTEVKACSWWGDTAEANLLSHYDAQWTPSNTETTKTTDEWVDRRGPAMMIISGPK